MFTLIVKGARNATLAYHQCDSRAELDELLAVYHALGYQPESLIVDDHTKQKAA